MRKEINDFDVNSRRVVWGGCTVYWAAYIYGLSAQTADESSELSSGLTERILRFFYLEFDKLTPEVQQSLVDAMHSGIRKAAHMFLYAVFAALVYLFVRTYFEKRNSVAVISLGVCLLLGCGRVSSDVRRGARRNGKRRYNRFKRSDYRTFVPVCF